MDDSNDKWYIAGSMKDSRPFADTRLEEIKLNKVSIDPVNFSQNDYRDLMNFYQKDYLLETECLMRKSFFPDSEIMLTLMTGTIALLAGKKVVAKLTGQVRLML